MRGVEPRGFDSAASLDLRPRPRRRRRRRGRSPSSLTGGGEPSSRPTDPGPSLSPSGRKPVHAAPVRGDSAHGRPGLVPSTAVQIAVVDCAVVDRAVVCRRSSLAADSLGPSSRRPPERRPRRRRRRRPPGATMARRCPSRPRASRSPASPATATRPNFVAFVEFLRSARHIQVHGTRVHGVHAHAVQAHGARDGAVRGVARDRQVVGRGAGGAEPCCSLLASTARGGALAAAIDTGGSTIR